MPLTSVAHKKYFILCFQSDAFSLCSLFAGFHQAFEIAERRLGIPALLDPGAMVSTKEPDCLSVITYLSRFYCFFNRKSQGGLSTMPPLRCVTVCRMLLVVATCRESVHAAVYSPSHRNIIVLVFACFITTLHILNGMLPPHLHRLDFSLNALVCMSPLDFAAGRAGARSSHAKSKTSDALKRLMVNIV